MTKSRVNVSIKQLKKLIAEELQSVQPKSSLSNCSFIGVNFDAKSVEAIQIIAQGLVENAKGLGKLAEVLNASNVTIDAMVKVDNQ